MKFNIPPEIMTYEFTLFAIFLCLTLSLSLSLCVHIPFYSNFYLVYFSFALPHSTSVWFDNFSCSLLLFFKFHTHILWAIFGVRFACSNDRIISSKCFHIILYASESAYMYCVRGWCVVHVSFQYSFANFSPSCITVNVLPDYTQFGLFFLAFFLSSLLSVWCLRCIFFNVNICQCFFLAGIQMVKKKDSQQAFDVSISVLNRGDMITIAVISRHFYSFVMTTLSSVWKIFQKY